MKYFEQTGNNFKKQSHIVVSRHQEETDWGNKNYAQLSESHLRKRGGLKEIMHRSQYYSNFNPFELKNDINQPFSSCHSDNVDQEPYSDEPLKNTKRSEEKLMDRANKNQVSPIPKRDGQDDMFLVITAHKPPPDSSNMLLCDDVESLKHLIWKQEMSNKKLKEQNQALRKEKQDLIARLNPPKLREINQYIYACRHRIKKLQKQKNFYVSFVKSRELLNNLDSLKNTEPSFLFSETNNRQCAKEVEPKELIASKDSPSLNRVVSNLQKQYIDELREKVAILNSPRNRKIPSGIETFQTESPRFQSNHILRK